MQQISFEGRSNLALVKRMALSHMVMCTIKAKHEPQLTKRLNKEIERADETVNAIDIKLSFIDTEVE